MLNQVFQLFLLKWCKISLNAPGLLPLFRAETVAIVRHVKIISDANPYDPEWNQYFEKRKSAKYSVMEPGLQEADHWLEPYAA